MATTQQFLPTSTAAHPSGSRGLVVALTGLALVTLVGSLAWLVPRSGAQSPEPALPGTFTTYGVSDSTETVSSPYDSLYPAAPPPATGKLEAARTSVTITSPSTQAAKAAALAALGRARNRDVNPPGGSVYNTRVPAAAGGTLSAWPGPHEGQGD